MQGLYGRAYGTLTANVENLTPAAQGGGLSPLQPARWTGDNVFATLSTANTPPAQASPTVPYPGQPQYGLQQGPNYATVTGYGSADYEVGYRGWRDYLPSFLTGGDAEVQTQPITYTGGGNWQYEYTPTSYTFVATHPDGRILDLAPGIRGYKAVVTEAIAIAQNLPAGVKERAIATFDAAFAKANSTPETRSPVNRGRQPAPSIVPAPLPASGAPAPAPGMSREVKIALAVLGGSILVGGALVLARRRRRA